MTIREIITDFYNSLAQKNDAWQKNLAPDVVFSDASGKLHAEGREAFIQSFTSFLRSVEKVQMKQPIRLPFSRIRFGECPPPSPRNVA